MELVRCSSRRNRDSDFDELELNPRKRQLSRNTTTIDDLEDSLLTEILLRLPLITAKRCQAVSKRWYALISDPYFITRFDQLQLLNKRTFAFLFHYDLYGAFDENRQLLVTSNEPYFKSERFSLKFLPIANRCWQPFLLQESATVVASCNDLLLCSTHRCMQGVYYICNPLTLNWAKLPPPPHPREGICDVGLMCDYNYDYSAAATSACKYAVVRIPESDFSTVFKVQIFSSDTGEWRENVMCSAPRKFHTGLSSRNGIPFKGLLFWLNPRNGLVGLDPYNCGQLRFIDVPSEFFTSSSASDNEGFGVCNGRLRLFKISKDPVFGIFLLSIWDLNGYEKGEWILKKRVYFRDMVSKYSSWLTKAAKDPEFSPRVLGCEPDDSDVLHIVTMDGAVIKVVSCNLQMGTLEEVCDAPADSEFVCDVITYKLSWWPTPINSPSSTRSYVSQLLKHKQGTALSMIFLANCLRHKAEMVIF